MMRKTSIVRNILPVIAWGIITFLMITFNNHTLWLLWFFCTPFLLMLAAMILMPLEFLVDGVPKSITLNEEDPIVIRVYQPRRTWFRLVQTEVHFHFEPKHKLKSQPLLWFGNRVQEHRIDTEKLSRGYYKCQGMTLYYRDWFGLFERSIDIDKVSELIVCPKMMTSLDGVYHALQKQFNLQSPYRNRENFDLKQIREYRVGDRLNHIDWKRSSKTDAMYYREYHQEYERPLSFIFVSYKGQYDAWMLSLFYTLELRYFKNDPLVFGVLDHTLISKPNSMDYAMLQFMDDPEIALIKPQSIIFTPQRVESNGLRIAQIYVEKRYLILEAYGQREVIGEIGVSV